MTLHPQARRVLRHHQPFDLTMTPVASIREAVELSTPQVAGPPPPVAATRDLRVGKIAVRLYRPVPDTALPVWLYLHGGGWVYGSIAAFDAVCRRMTNTSQAAVLAVEYRLAPEHVFPAALDDVLAVLAWVRQGGPKHGLDPHRIGIAGDSAGAHLATLACARERDAGQPLLAQALIYPALDPLMESASYDQLDGYTLTRREMVDFWEAFVPAGMDRTDPTLAPLRMPLAGLPPTLVLTAEYDVLRDEGERYATALAEAGVPVTAVRYAGLVHGFFRRLAVYDAAGVAADHVATFLAGHLVARPCR